MSRSGTAGTSSYGQILKSSALVGGSSFVNVAAGMVRSKAFAVLLGPAGFGLMGVYWSIVNFAESVAGMGVNTAGVRQIAAAAGSGEGERVARTAMVLRRTSLALGLLGAVALAVLSGPVSRLTFASGDHTLAIALLSLAVLFRTLGAGQGALIQGLRRIGDLARSGVIGGLVGTAASIGLVFAFREGGIVPSVIATEGAFLLLAWWFSRKLALTSAPVSLGEVGREAGALLKLGFAFMASGMLGMGAAYAVRLIVVRALGIEAAGLYQSAWTVGGLYVGFILQAMGADFYPRVTATAGMAAESNRLVNEQTHTSLLLAGPGVLGTVTFAPVVVPLFYSAAFQDAVDLLRWFCLGVTLRVVTWPLGFVIVAQARQRTFLLVEVGYTLGYLVLSWLGVGLLGLDGSGVAFFLSYVLHGMLVYPAVHRLTGFRWSATNVRLAVSLLALVGAVFASFHLLPWWLATALGAVATAGTAAYSIRALGRLVPLDRLPSAVRHVLRWSRLVPERHEERGSP